MTDPTIAAEGAAPLGLPDWRRRILDRTLLAGALLGPLAYVPSVWLSVREHLWGLVALDTLLYGWVLLLALRPKWPYSLRASSVVAMVLLMALVLGPTTGLRETALIWFEFAAIAAALFLSRRSAYAVFGASLLALVGITFFMKSTIAPLGSPAWMGWVVTACNGVVIGGTVTLALTVLLRGLEDTNLSLVRKAEEHRQAEAALQRLEAELRRSQSLEVLGTLASGITHDLKNILHPILALTELAQDELAPGSPAHQLLGDVLAAAERGKDLTQRILSFSRPRTALRHLVPVETVLDEVSRLLRPTLPLGVRVRVLADPPLAQVEADSIELHQVLLNLGTNAAHAMRTTGGELLFRLRWVSADQIAIQVLDEGIGMDAETLARACEPLFTTKPEHEGTGLGLAMSLRIVEGLGGTLVLSSSPGQGCMVEIRLPAVPQEQLQRA
jgi:signal transduction histidine kinase